MKSFPARQRLLQRQSRTAHAHEQHCQTCGASHDFGTRLYLNVCQLADYLGLPSLTAARSWLKRHPAVPRAHAPREAIRIAKPALDRYLQTQHGSEADRLIDRLQLRHGGSR